MHTESHAPPQTKLTFRKLPFHAQPYLMPRDTVANRAATKVLHPHPCISFWHLNLCHSDGSTLLVCCMRTIQGCSSGDLQTLVVIMLGLCTGILWDIHLRTYTCAAELLTSLLVLQVLKELFKGPFYYREGGSIPALALMKEHLGIWCTSFGFGLSTDNLHSPNERWPKISSSSACSLLKAQNICHMSPCPSYLADSLLLAQISSHDMSAVAWRPFL